MNIRTSPLIFLFLVLFLGFSFFSPAASAAEKIWSAQITYAAAGDTEDGHPIAAIHISLADGYYVYSHHGDAEMPTELTLPGKEGKALPASILYPQGELRPDLFEPGKQVLAYTGDFFIFVRPETLSDSRSFTASLSMLACSRRNCVPIMDKLSLTFPDPLPILDYMEWKEIYAGLASSALPLQSSKPNQDDSAPVLSAPAPDGASWGFSPRYPQDALEPAALGTALLLGLLAGLILNAMPCVLPVLTMKISALLAASGHADDQARIAHFREHNLLFAAGILSWFFVLAICVGVFGLAWGGLFQDSRIVFGLLLLVFLLSLSLFDVFTLPVLDFKIGASGTPRMQAYLTGLVATLLATPCSGPLLGGVLGWAALQPLPIVIAVFIATGLGMAAPYLLLVACPGAARILPKPGAWTGVMERLVGFFLMGTALYLLSILPEALRLSALAVLLVASLAAWTWGRWGSFRASGTRKLLIAALAVFMIGGSIGWAFAPQPAPAPWTTFSVATFRSLWGQTPLLVEFTADWCPSCKVLEHTVLTPSRLHGLIERYGVRLIKVDLTRPDPEAEALLRALGSVSIPVAAIFPTGDMADSPIVLRDLYTADQLEKALSTLLPRKN